MLMRTITKQKLWAIYLIIFIGCFSLVFTQRFPLYIDVTNTKNLAPSSFLQKKLETIDAPFKFTFFTSDNLSRELNLDLLKHWLTSISNTIEIQQFDPVKFPAKADHYDITTDGVIVIEFENRRQDIDLIEQIIINESHGLENIQNTLSRAIIQLSQTSPPEILLIHSNMGTLLDTPEPMGLSELKNISSDNFINITESHVNELSKLNHQYDLVIFYKLSESAKDRLPVLQRLYQQSPSTMIFNHPKFAEFSNQLLPDETIQFSPGILEDRANHLLRSENQLIVEYNSHLSQTLVGVFPYSSFINYDATSGIRPLATTGEDAYLLIAEDVIPGPFPIILQNTAKTRTYVNNYLITTNFWISQGDNRRIIEDLLHAHLDPFPIISTRDTSDDYIILTKTNAIKLAIILIILPLLAISLIAFLHQISQAKSRRIDT